MKSINILKYDNYCDFLRDYAKSKKSVSPSWSLQVWSKKLGLRSSSSLSMVINGKRQISTSLAKKMINYFSLNENEARHFYLLIQKMKIELSSENLKIHFFPKSTKDPREHLEASNTPNEMNLFSWKTYAVREMVLFKDFRPDPSWISKKMNNKISSSEIKKIWKFLLENNFVYSDGENWHLSAKDFALKASDLQSVRRFHTEMTDLSREAIEIPFEERSFHTSILAIDKKKMKEFKILLSQFQTQLTQSSKSESPTDIYQFNMMLFPISR